MKQEFLQKSTGILLAAAVMASASGMAAAEAPKSGILDWTALYNSLGIEGNVDAVSSATNYHSFHASGDSSGIPQTVVREDGTQTISVTYTERVFDEATQTTVQNVVTADEAQILLTGVNLTGKEAAVTPAAASASFAYTSSYGTGEFVIVPDDSVENYSWNDFLSNLYAVTISDGTAAVGCLPWVDFYGEPATEGAHYNKLQIAVNNGESIGSNKANVTRFSAFYDADGFMKAGSYTVTVYSEGYAPLIAENITVLPHANITVPAEIDAAETGFCISDLPEDIQDAAVKVTYSVMEEGMRRPTVKELECSYADGSVSGLDISQLSGFTLSITISSANYAPVTASCAVQ